MDWQPITTAPRDGTDVLVWRPRENSDHVAHAGVDRWSENAWFRSRRYQQPTHWMPLPAPPAASLIAKPANLHEPVDITGWKLVPDQPTSEMWDAGRSADIHPGDSYSKVWSAMFDAAPNVDDCETIGRAARPSEAAVARTTTGLIDFVDDLDRHGTIDKGVAQELKLRITALASPPEGAVREAELRLIKVCAKIAESHRYSDAAKACTNGARIYGNDEACEKIAEAIRALHPSKE